MKAIETKYHGPGNVRGSRFIASDLDGNRVVCSADDRLNSDDNHKAAAVALCRKMKWSGKLQGGFLKGCMVWTFEDDRYQVTVEK